LIKNRLEHTLKEHLLNSSPEQLYEELNTLFVKYLSEFYRYLSPDNRYKMGFLKTDEGTVAVLRNSYLPGRFWSIEVKVPKMRDRSLDQ